MSRQETRPNRVSTPSAPSSQNGVSWWLTTSAAKTTTASTAATLLTRARTASAAVTMAST